MKVIIKIDDYYPEQDSVVIRISRLHSFKSIDEHRTFAIDCYDIDKTTIESFVDGLIFKVKHLIQEQDENEKILESNTPVEIDGELELDFQKIIGKNIETKIPVEGRNRLLNMRRVHL